MIDLKTAPAPLLAAVLDLNRLAEVETSPLDLSRLRQLVDWALLAVATDDAQAFLLAFGPGSPYDSPNYRWFAARYPRFAYIDRVVVAPAARGRGLARALYAHLAARTDAPLVCEVNSQPPNPVSDVFHAALGFAEAGRAVLRPGKEVRYLIRQEAP